MKVRVRKDVPAPAPVPWGIQDHNPWRDGGRRGAGHGVRALGWYLFPVHQEENSPNELRDEDEAHEDEELEGRGMKGSEANPVGSSLWLLLPSSAASPARALSPWGMQGASAQLLGTDPTPLGTGAARRRVKTKHGLGMPKKLGCRCSEGGF